MSAADARLAELRKIDLATLSDQQRGNLSRLFQIHPAGLDALHAYSRRTYPASPPDGPQRVSDAEFARMGPAERITYARQFPQWRSPNR